MKKFAIIFAVIVVAIFAFLERGRVNDWLVERQKPAVPNEQPRLTPTPSPTPTPTPPGQTATPTPSRAPTPTPSPVTGAINLAVPFYSQAPRGDWSLPWQEACEEASAVLVDAYWNDDPLSVEEMEARILALVDWQQRTFGYYEHTTAAETARMIKEVFGYKRVDVIQSADIADIAEQVRAGRPVIVPLAGRLLGNKFYTQPGPVYHMLVVKGIAENGDIITNDVGTRHGRNLTYAPNVFLNAMHDVPEGGATWPSGVDPAEYIKTGARRIIVVYPN
jgi:hypothetical protein